jgi:hypothetical protein
MRPVVAGELALKDAKDVFRAPAGEGHAELLRDKL